MFFSFEIFQVLLLSISHNLHTQRKNVVERIAQKWYNFLTTPLKGNMLNAKVNILER